MIPRRYLRSAVALVLALLSVVALVGCEAGPRGEQGERGPTGSIGAPGRTGGRGDGGVTGGAGPAGATGPQGEIGLQGVAGPQGEIGLQGIRGLDGAQGIAPSEEELLVLIGALIDLGSGGDIALGGKLYDNWMLVTGTTPEGDNPMWADQSTNLSSGAATWQCSECHGWDYKGKDGLYGSGDHFTGFTGIYRAGSSFAETRLVDVLQGSLDVRHDFSDYLTTDQLNALAAFLNTGIVNDVPLLDRETRLPRYEVDLGNGEHLYIRSCGACHGDDGTDINSGTEADPIYIATASLADPWQYMHNTRFGVPESSGMPATDARGWSIQDVIDVIGYSNTLPAE